MTTEPTPEPLADAIRAAYQAGAEAVHDAWVAGDGQTWADFGEASSDYAASVDLDAITLWSQRTSPPTPDNAPHCPACKSTNICWDKTDCIYICNECGGTCPDNAALEATGKQAWEAELRGANLVEELADLIREWRFDECVSVMDIAQTLLPIITHREEQAWQDGAKAALDAAAKVARGWTGGPPDMGTKAACLIETGIHTIDPASLRKDR